MYRQSIHIGAIKVWVFAMNDGSEAHVQAVLLATQVLEVLADRGPCGVTDVARALDVPKMRIHRHLRTLVAAGYARQDPASEKYAIGVKFWLIGKSVADQFDFLSAARKVVTGLRDALGHTVTAGIIDGEDMLMIDTERGTSQIEIGTKPGSRFAFHASSQGKLALAFGPADLMDKVLSGPLEETTPKTCTDPDELRAEVSVVKRQGWAVAPEQILIGINALAAPVFYADGSLAGTLSVVDSIQFLPAQPSDHQIGTVLSAARQASAELGYSPEARKAVGGRA